MKRSDGRTRGMRRKIASVSLCVFAVLSLTLFSCFVPFSSLLPPVDIPARAEGDMRIHFLSAGQADCTIVEFPEGDVLIVDGGNGSWAWRTKIARYLEGLRANSVTLLLTHADADHYGSFREIIKKFGAEKLYLPLRASDSKQYRALLQTAEEYGCETETVSRYTAIVRPSGAYAVCISPRVGDEGTDNDCSAVIYLSYAGVNTLLCGDITSSREKFLLREYAIDEALYDVKGCAVRLRETDILKVAHHGSGGASSAEWLSLLGAQTAVISCGRGNAYSHPASGALDAITYALPSCEIYRTDELGDIVVTVKNGTYTLSTNQTE